VIRLAFTSDLHTDSHPANRRVWQEMVAILREVQPDVFVCCGDVAASARQVALTLFALEPLPCPKLFVPGNHDIWLPNQAWRRQGITSQDKYYKLLPALCREAGFHPLWVEPYVCGGVAFCGSMGWYDYSLRNPGLDERFSRQDYRRKSYEGLQWNDAQFVHWRSPQDGDGAGKRLADEAVTGRMVEELHEQLQRARRRAARLIVVTHMLPFQTMVRHFQEPQRDYFSAFMGSARLGNLLLEWPEVELVLAGHTHRQVTVQVGHIMATTSPLGYARQWRSQSPREVACERLTFLDIS
jgi:3',5'-cyclic AMP phosphodiesterase CpdA